jgi:outer membrane murein-binding lipoprotein Lpp
MKSMFKFIIMLIALAAIFGAGYLTGSQRTERLNRLLTSARSEMASKVSGLEGEVSLLRFRMQLTTARDRMLTAQNQIRERNFGSAEKELESAKEDLKAAAKITTKDRGDILLEVMASIDGAIAVIQRSDPRAKVKLEAAEAALDRFMGQL